MLTDAALKHLKTKEKIYKVTDRDRDCADVDAIAREHLTEVERKIADLSMLRRELRDLIGNCSRGTVAECRIIDALSPV